ncbi:1-phosphatidylinositol phosphodiesterase-like [Centruroides vittatus]|uniref:1-phosphatidylinositol phosphodiesterase-like n=1 Tax=Centruroides vittatus TaxID=120091 RepID=UPI0035104215
MTTTNHYNTSYDPDISNDRSRWMSKIPDNKSLADISIAGSHGSLVYYGGDAYQCQTFPIKKQFQAGIRFLDVSCKCKEEKLYIYQRSVNQRTSFGDLLCSIFAFLNDNDSECIILNVTPDENENIENWNNLLHSYINAFGKRNFWLNDSIPEMKTARGKIVLLKPFVNAEIGIGNGHLDLFQNEHVRTLFSVASAWEGINRHLKSIEYNPDKLFVTYCCGHSWFAYPYSVANTLNQELLKFLEYQDLRSWGIIALDFPGLELIEEIINSND